MAQPFNKFNTFVADVANKVHNLGSDQLKVALTNSAPVATNTVIANITQVSYTNLSGATPLNLTLTSSSQSSGTYKLILQDLTLTATGAVGPFRYVVIYNSTAANSPLIGWYDTVDGVTITGSTTMANGDTFLIDLDNVNGLLQIT